MNVAIIGGGVGGLAVAYNLLKKWPAAKGPPPAVTVYEASGRFGGNGDTVSFALGYDMAVFPKTPPYMRWADLGVNDFNKSAYTHLVEAMDEIGFTAYLPLEDTTSYYTLDGSTIFSDEGAPLFTSPTTAMPEALSKASAKFMEQAAVDGQDPQYASYSVRRYMDEVFSHNPAYDARLGPLVIYPRINGMYFTDDIDASGLPLSAVMHYYSIQEGAGGPAPQRMYFTNGASDWINALATYLTGTMGVTLAGNFRAALSFAGGWRLTNTLAPGAPALTPDVVVVATHADDAGRLISGGVAPAVMNTLAQVKYLDGLSVAHTFPGVLPPDCNAWATYNILIHQSATYLKPYTISYVCNRHQNDGNNPLYSHFGWPQFFITVNPPVPIPMQYVLTDAATGLPAIANLRHNVYDFACQAAQLAIQEHQGVNDLYFAGGWTVGAGLHEECWIQGQAIAKQIITGAASNDHLYDRKRGPHAYAPQYMRRLLQSRP